MAAQKILKKSNAKSLKRVKNLVQKSNTQVHFPVGIFAVAFLKDLLDLITFGLFSFLFSFLFFLIFMMWILSFRFKYQTSFNSAQKLMQRLLLKSEIRLSIFMILGSIPFLGAIIPESSVLVVLTYKELKKALKNNF